jgi:hypothetical protein
MHAHFGLVFALLAFVSCCSAVLNATETTSRLTLSNDRFYASVNKTTGGIDRLYLDGQNLLGFPDYATPRGVGPYLDCMPLESSTHVKELMLMCVNRLLHSGWCIHPWTH